MNKRTAAVIGWRLFKRAGWAPTAVFLFHAFVSRVLDAYTIYPSIDIPMHLLGGLAIAYFFSGCFSAIPGQVVSTTDRWLIEFIVVASLTATAAVFWEFAEFASDTFLGTSSLMGLEDTLLDLALGIVGGVAYLSVTLRLGRLGVVRPLE